MFLSQRELDVDRREQSEDVGLKYGYENFEEGEDKAECERARTEELESALSLKEEELRGREAEHEQEVAGDHVHEKSQRQGDRTQDKNREELNGRHDDVNRPRHTGREKRCLQERTGVLAQTCVDEHHVGDDGHDNRHTHQRGAGNVEAGNDARDVQEQRGPENCGEQRQEASAVFLAQQVFGDVDANEVEAHLDEALEATGNNRHLSRAQPEQQNEQGRHDDANHDDAVDFERRAHEQERRREELHDRRTDKSSVFSRSGEHKGDVT